MNVIGYWFSPNKKLATYFRVEPLKVFEVFLSIKNPKVYESNNSVNYGDSYQLFRSDIYSLEGLNSFDANKYGIQGIGLDNPIETKKRYLEQLIKNNHDGIFINNTKADSLYADGLNNQIIAFNSNQIKLADGTNTTFDGNNPDIRYKDGGELAMGIKAEHEHSKTIDKFKQKGVSDLDVEMAIAKDHLKEDPHYYSKLAKMEQKFAKGGAVTVNGVDYTIGDKGTYNGKVKESITIISISPKIVTYITSDGKKKGVYTEKFQKYFVADSSVGSIQTPVQPSSPLNVNERIKNAVEIFDSNGKLVLDLPPYLKFLAKLNQVKKGNKGTDNISLDKNSAQGNFDWSQSNEGDGFWTYIWEGDWTEPEVLKVVGSKENLFLLPSQVQNKPQQPIAQPTTSYQPGDVLVFEQTSTGYKYEAKTGARAIFEKENGQFIDVKWIRDKFSSDQSDGGYNAEDFSFLYRPQNGLLMEDTIGMTIDYEGESYQITKVEFSERYKAYEVYYESPKIDDYFYIWKQDNQIEKFLRGEKTGSFRLLLNTTNVTQPQVFKVGDKVKIPLTKSLGDSYGKSNSIQQAKQLGQDFLYVGAGIDSDGVIVLNYENEPTGDFFDVVKDNIQLYEQPSVIQEQPTTETKTQATHKEISEVKTERDLLIDEYNDVLFLIENTLGTDVDNMLSLKSRAKELKDKLDTLDLEIKKKNEGEINLLETLFDASTITPQERPDLKAYNDGFAPDGQPTSLPKNIYEWTTTEEFQNWFGNFTLAYNYRNSSYANVPCSVIVNKNHEPLIVYHGTGGQFSFFKFDKFPAMYFAENEAYSNWFAELKGKELGTQGYVYPFFLNIRMPLDLTGFEIDDISGSDFIDWMYLQTGLDADELKINKALLDPNRKFKAWMYLRNSPEMLQVLRDKNIFDGIIYYEDNPSVDSKSDAYKTKAYIIFNAHSAKIAEPNRHKLAIPAMRSFYLKRGGKV